MLFGAFCLNSLFEIKKKKKSLDYTRQMDPGFKWLRNLAPLSSQHDSCMIVHLPVPAFTGAKSLM